MTQAIDKYGMTLLIDFDTLREKSDNLVGAIIFNRLFNLVEAEPPFVHTEMNVNDDGKLTILYDYGISAIEWRHFMYFIKKGVTEHFAIAFSDLPESTAYKKLCIQNLEQFYLHGVPNKLGPFPAIDEYYKNIMTINKNTINKNPQTPDQDNGNLFYWTKHGSLKNNDIQNDEDKWNITSGEINSCGHNYWRKKRKIENNIVYDENDVDVI